MKILSIETSADETAVSVVQVDGDFPTATYTILGNALFSQVDSHKEYGGIYPTLAKREHAKTLPLMLTNALKEAGLLKAKKTPHLEPDHLSVINETLHREPGLGKAMTTWLKANEPPEIDLIGVTSGPGLEPALWVGINLAKILALVWEKPIRPVNHMEGHLLASVFDGKKLAPLEFPALGLLISGGHTELDLMTDWHTYTCIGKTRDDAVGEAFDKVARMLGLGYPGGPALDDLVIKNKQSIENNDARSGLKLPRPMLSSNDLDFSFSGLKTAVRYLINDRDLTKAETIIIANEFVDAVSEVLIKKCHSAIDRYGIKSLIIGGGVSASRNIKTVFLNYFKTNKPNLKIYIPDTELATDNAIMIALTAGAKSQTEPPVAVQDIVANGNLALEQTDG